MKTLSGYVAHMQSSAQLTVWLDHLRLLVPPRHLVLVGAGNGDGPWVQWMMRAGLASATLLEADDGQMDALQRRISDMPGWRTRKQVVASQTTSVTFHVASVTSESGLLEPEQLRDLWPNITTRKKHTRQAISLAEVLHDDEPSASWLMLDCLPSLAILQGAADQLTGIDVLVVRVRLEDSGEPRSDGVREPPGLLRWLAERGLHHMSTETGRHPALGHAVFVRNAAERLEAEHAEQRQQIEAVRTAAEGLAAERLQQIEQLQHRLKDVQAQAKSDAGHRATQAAQELAELQRLKQLHKAAEGLATERLQQIEQLQHRLKDVQTQAKSDAGHRATQAAQELAELQRLKQLHKAAEGLATERLQRIEQLQHCLKDVQTQAKSDASHRATQAAQELAELQRLKQLHEAAAGARADLEKSLSERSQALQKVTTRLEQLEGSHLQLQHVHKLLTTEMARVRAQIALMDGLQSGGGQER